MSDLFFGAFAIVRRYDARPERVFRAFADREIKQRWLGCEEVSAPVIERLDFEVGGREISRGGGEDGAEHLFEGTYLDIVDGRRFVFAFVMHVGGRKISASLGTVEFTPDGEGTVLTFNEQGVYFGEDGWAGREEGTAAGLDQLGVWLASQQKDA
ncbi:SRPBCC domain-containing protein [Brevundimonas sp.]|uniref:SRPBCC domain-containing protein n=1 Tax=Brevundimonas sp. TaxID=1871086 RepID=UPI002737EFB0|nr:SRPBCC domain-containing protein [Brevundimonas sp.]MDP3802667.1 SRPBCC domain-containing protein [Brevundimonas sp.]